MSVFLNTLISAAALAVACALLSVVVVLCRWAFIGEGISHSGFGGAGTAWLLMLIFPALDKPWMPFFSVTVFCLLTAIGIGVLSRARDVNADAAIGIFLVASLAWGFLCQQLYTTYRHAKPILFENLLWGQVVVISSSQAWAATFICIAIITVLVLLQKEILSYSFDPQLAASSGVRARFIHYLLMLLLGVVIIAGARLVGTVLMTALLVLPAATALRLTRRLEFVTAFSIVVALIGVIGGLMVNRVWPSFPPGPVIVLLMFVQFLAALVASCLGGSRQLS